jgi:hypothetical protein
MRDKILAICIKHGLIIQTATGYKQVPADKYPAFCELAKLYNGNMPAARTAIHTMINRVNLGRDPLKDNRGGARPGSGRKFVTQKQG